MELMKTSRITVDEAVDRLMIISDIHAYIEPLNALDDVIAASSFNIQVVAAGDFLDSGANPTEVMNWVIRHAGRFAVIGNHDTLALDRGDPAKPVYTDVGSLKTLDQEQIDYLRNLPDVLELEWKGKKIRITHYHTPSGNAVPWTMTKAEMITAFSAPSFDLSIAGHTHFPFVWQQDGIRVANSGSTSSLILARRQTDGSIAARDGSLTFSPPPEIYSTYLLLSVDESEIQTTLEHFDYDREAAISHLRHLNDPDAPKKKKWIETGIIWC